MSDGEPQARADLALLLRVSRACGHSMRRADDDLATNEVRRKAFARVTGCVRYLTRLHGELPAALRRRAVPALHDAFAWGLLAYVHDLAERPEQQSADATELYEALGTIAPLLRKHGLALRESRLLHRAETRHRNRLIAQASETPVSKVRADG